MKILITGGLGHIGSALIRNLYYQIGSCHIDIVDNLSTQRYCSLFNLPEHTSYNFVEGDVTGKNLNQFGKPDVVVHLAAKTDAASSYLNPQQVRDNNLGSTSEIINFCIKHDCPLIYPSSTSVYGKQDGSVDENCSENDLQPQSPYAESKIDEENLIKNTKSLNYEILRLGTIYGYSIGMRFHTAVNKFCFQAVCKKPLTVWKTAEFQKRPYLGIYDCSKTIGEIIRSGKYNSNVTNILSHNSTVADIITTINKSGYNCEINYVDSAIMNQLSYNVCNKRMKHEMGILPNDIFEPLIRQTLNILENSNASA